MGKWQPIETAPAYGVDFLVWVPGEDEDCEPYVCQAYRDDVGDVVCVDPTVVSGGMEPTHWMPLPPPPGAEDQLHG